MLQRLPTCRPYVRPKKKKNGGQWRRPDADAKKEEERTAIRSKKDVSHRTSEKNQTGGLFVGLACDDGLSQLGANRVQ